jgi:hypothetical protein
MMTTSTSFAEHRIDQIAWHPVALDDTEASWRDFAQGLTPDQIGRLEEIAREIGERPTGVMLGLARWFATKTALDAMIGDVSAPTGVSRSSIPG